MQITNTTQPSSGVQAPVTTAAAVRGNTGQSSSIADSTADTVSITANKIMIAQQLVTQQVDIALEIKSPMTYASHDSDDDHADNLVNKIIQKIHHEKASNDDDLSDEDKHLAAVKSVQVKVAQGFESATFAMTRLGVMDDSVATNVEQTRSRVDAAINQVASQPAGDVGSANVETATVNMVSAKRELASSLQITTREGDVVTLNFNRSQAVTAGSAEGAGGSLAYAGAASSSLIEFSVQGDLSEKESKSISKVVKRINQLAEKLFSGKTGAAMEKLSELKINTKHLASMSLSMSSSISYQAVSAYVQVSHLPVESSTAVTQSSVAQSPVPSEGPSKVITPEAPALPVTPAEPAGSSVVQVAQETAEVVSEVVASDIFEDPFKEIRNLFAQIADMFSFEHHNVKHEHKNFMSELFKDMVDKLEDDHGEDHDHDSDEDEHAMAA